MKANPFMRLLEFLLVVALLLQFFPANALALSSLDHAETAPQVTEEPEETIASEDVHVLGELSEERTEFSKTYRLSNGLNMATVYPDAIHFEEDGSWKDIDNTLKLASDTDGDVYTNTAGSWQVALPKELSRDKGVEVTKGENTVRFYLAGPLHSGNDLAAQSGARTIESSVETHRLGTFQTASAAVEEIDLTAELEAAEHPETVLENLTSRLRYENIHNNTDVVYDLQGNRLKESIIMQEYDAQLRGYSYVLEIEGMVPVLNEDGSIGLYEKDAAEPAMTMPAPYLLDDAGAYCADVEVSLTEQNSAYTLTYLLPMEWLAEEERVWPVVLDPAIKDEAYRANTQDHTVHANYPHTHVVGSNADTVTCGFETSVGIMRFCMQYTSLPKLTAADVIVNATLKLYLAKKDGGALPVEVHEVTGPWDEDTLTWDTRPKYNTAVEDYAICETSGFYYPWDITRLVKKWYTGDNYGVMFKLSAENEKSYHKMIFYSSDVTSDDLRPMLTLTYRNNSGLESYWDYSTASAGRAGTGHVNQYTGNLVWVREDLGFGGNRMPVSISHVYNSCDKDKNLFGLGYGWRTNYNQRVYQRSQDSVYYVWEDGDGTKHYFKYSSSGKYLDEDGMELTLRTTGSDDTKYSIKDKNGNASYFDESGRLTRISNNQETKSSIKITYKGSSDRIANIEDGAGRMYYYTYTDDDLLDRLIYKGTGDTTISSVDFEYTNKNLTKITDEDGKSCTYGYQSGHILARAKDIAGIQVSYSFLNPESETQPVRVSGIQESDEAGSTSVAGGSLTIEYDNNQTKLTDNNGVVNIIQFNDLGNTVAVQDDRGRAQFMQFAINGLSTADAPDNAKSNQLRLGSRLQNTVGNVLRNSSFEEDGNWSAADAVSVSYVTTESKYGRKALKMTRETAGAASGVRSPFFSVPAGDTYTFSAYVLTKNASAYLALKEESSGTFFRSEVQETHTDWTRLEVSYTNKTDVAQDVSARFMTKDAGVAYMDCVQVEAASAASRYNLVENGDFRYTTDWSSDEGRMTRNSAAPELSDDAYRLVGDPTEKKYIYQTVAVSGKEGDTYVLAGWAKADSVPIRDDRKFALIATFNNTDGTTTSSAVEFNPSAGRSIAWQYAAEPIVAKKDYDSILVKIAYYYNDNNAYFDGIQLFKEEFGSSYTYDENGNVISVKDAQGKKTSYEYSNNNLTKEVLPNGAEMKYTYDDWHNVKTATTGEGLKYTFTYDTYGNNTSVTIQDGDITLTSTAEYNANGNRLVSTTDTAGNITRYSYDPDTNVLNYVKYPRDSIGDEEGEIDSRTYYTYYSMLRLASATANVRPSGTLSVNYGYDGDRMTSVRTPTTTYNFEYGDFGLTEKVRIGTRDLATYTYTEQNNFLQKLEYANGDSVEYTYNKYGQLRKQVYEDGAKVIYRYDNSGALAQVEDYATGILTKYMYDLSDRLMMYEEEAGEQTHRVRYYYDAMNNLTKVREGFDGVNRTTTYTYDKDNRVTGIAQSDTSEAYTYDDYGRFRKATLTHGDLTIEDIYTYQAPSDTQTAMQVYKQTTKINGAESAYRYTYDANGNITSVNDGTYTTTYVYDSANQLLRENNEKAGKTWGWTYDDGGNIRTKTEYAYTTGTVGEALDTVTYNYSASSWGDLLISHDGNTIVSDDSGNMLSYGDDKTFTWKHGRELSGMTDDSGTWSFEYNADGLRVYRSNGTTEYKYYYNGDKLTRMVVNGQNITFGYDANGAPQYVLYDGNRYFYLTNLQGDVTAIVSVNGNIVVEYTYDAWGNVLSIEGVRKDNLGKLNPLRYRGYVYDEETELYYLQSRYYDPAIGRFINADIYTSTGQGFVGNNMFAYCNNNPVVSIDTTGTRMEFSSFDSGAPVGFPSPSVVSQNKRHGEKSTAITNTDAQVVLAADYTAFYKGRFVVKVPGSSSFSFGIIFMGNEGNVDLLNHEYGHTIQLKELGIVDYSTYVVLPSVICFWGTELEVLSDENYYSYPWEYQADQYGGVTRTYKSWAKDTAAYYWNRVS